MPITTCSKCSGIGTVNDPRCTANCFHAVIEAVLTPPTIPPQVICETCEGTGVIAT